MSAVPNSSLVYLLPIISLLLMVNPKGQKLSTTLIYSLPIHCQSLAISRYTKKDGNTRDLLPVKALVSFEFIYFYDFHVASM